MALEVRQTEKNELDPITDTPPLPDKADVMTTAKFTAMLHHTITFNPSISNNTLRLPTLRKLPENIKKAMHKQLALLLSNPRHYSLNIKKMQDPKDIWEARISDSYRFTFQIKGDVYILRKVGTHDILKKP